MLLSDGMFSLAFVEILSQVSVYTDRQFIDEICFLYVAIVALKHSDLTNQSCEQNVYAYLLCCKEILICLCIEDLLQQSFLLLSCS